MAPPAVPEGPAPRPGTAEPIAAPAGVSPNAAYQPAAAPPAAGSAAEEDRSSAPAMEPAPESAPARGKQCPECGTQLPPGASQCPNCGYDVDLVTLGVGDKLPAFVDAHVRRAKVRGVKVPPATTRKRKRTFMIAVTTVTVLIVVGLCVGWAYWAGSGTQTKGGSTVAAEQGFVLFDWPQLYRSSFVKLYVDGKQMKVPEEGQIGGPLAPGKHHIKLDSGLDEPLEQTVDLKAGETVVLKVRYDDQRRLRLEGPPSAPATPEAKPPADTQAPQRQQPKPAATSQTAESKQTKAAPAPRQAAPAEAPKPTAKPAGQTAKPAAAAPKGK